MFLHVSVSHSVPSMPCRWYPSIPCRSQGSIPACLAGFQAHTQGKLRDLAWGGLQAHTQGEVEGSGLGESPGPHLGGLQAHTQGSLQAHTQGGLQAHTWGVSQHVLRQNPPADGYCCGWYASYWNAFLFYLDLYVPSRI